MDVAFGSRTEDDVTGPSSRSTFCKQTPVQRCDFLPQDAMGLEEQATQIKMQPAAEQGKTRLPRLPKYYCQQSTTSQAPHISVVF